MVDLGTLPGLFSNSYATGINDNNLVIGFSWKAIDDYATRGFAWTRAHGMVDIGTFGGDTYANAVNAGGLVVGMSYTEGNAESRPFAWTRAGGIVDLGSPESFLRSASATVASLSATATPLELSYPHPFAWTIQP
jgi:probable HAF family extracellular repeat protein